MPTEAVIEAHSRWKTWLRPTDGALDATAGNGKDTLLLSQLLPNGYVIGFDIQELALQRARERLKEQPHVTLHLRSHEEIDQVPLPFPPRLIIYNLGYLPGGDKTITTLQTTTLRSLEASLRCLAPDGALSIICYSGHPGGQAEEDAVWSWAEKLVGWNAERIRFERPHSPTLVWIRSD
jgi:SAM-dependent methyltransferase